MDLIKELEKIENNNVSYSTILDEFNQEKAEMDKKMHIINVLSIAKDVEDYINLNDFEAINIGGFEMDCCEDEDTKSQSISFSFFRCDGEAILHDSMKKKHPEILQRFREIFNGSNYKGLKDLSVKTEFLNAEFTESGWIEVDFIQDAGEVIVNSLLSKELKSILDYSKMQLELNNKKEPGKKLKV
jgi:hypothetical protein